MSILSHIFHIKKWCSSIITTNRAETFKSSDGTHPSCRSAIFQHQLSILYSNENSTTYVYCIKDKDQQTLKPIWLIHLSWGRVHSYSQELQQTNILANSDDLRDCKLFVYFGQITSKYCFFNSFELSISIAFFWFV